MPPLISRGFRGRRDDGPSDRVPPGQYLTRDFPVLSAGPTPSTPLDHGVGRTANHVTPTFSGEPQATLDRWFGCSLPS